MRTEKPFVSKEQIEKARRLDLLSYLEKYEPQELVKVSPGVYSTRSHDSLKISHGKWFRWSRGYGGVSALDYLVKVKEMDFVSAVKLLCDETSCISAFAPLAPSPIARTPFMLPKPNGNNNRVIDYLLRRGIGIGLIRYCIRSGRLYEDERHNCCFVGSDPQGIPRYAMLRSSATHSTFLREVDGSDKRFSFSLPPQKTDTLYVLESAIDTLSLAELQRISSRAWKPSNYLSLSGIYQPKKELADAALPVALSQFLQDNPHVHHVTLCMDNDEAGRNAALAIRALLPKRYTSKLSPPIIGKDYNEQLMHAKGISVPIKTRGASSALSHIKEEQER